MQPYSMGQDVFATQADERFNSFSDPMNAFNMNGGNNAGWGINSNYLTPSYTSPYRPQYQGLQGDPYRAYNPGILHSANHVFNPLESGGTNYGGNTYQQSSPYYDSLSQGVGDSIANVAQKVIIPGVASYYAYKWMSKPLGTAGERFASGAARGLIGNSLSASKTASIMRGAGTLGRLAGSTFAPLLAAEAAVWLADKAVFDPYIQQRKTTNDLRRNFAGVNFGDGSGNEVTGGGFSRLAANKQATQISINAAKDLTFNQQEMSNMTDLAARGGLLDNVAGSKIAERMKLITKQVKTVMAIANTSDFREAIEVLTKLQSAGVDPSKVISITTAIGSMASRSGISAQKFMNTAGAQGAYSFQGAGLNAYAGMLTAGSAMASFTSAQRSGFMSNSMLMRMGGVEGATQSATAGMASFAQSPYAGMIAYNAFTGRGTAGSVVGNVSRFGAAMSNNPITSMGKFNFHRAEMVSNMVENGGLGVVEDSISEIGRYLPGAMKKGGKIDAYAAYEIMTKTMGMPENEARAKLMHMRASQDKGSVDTELLGIERTQRELGLKALDQAGANKGIFTKPYMAAKKSINAGLAYMAEKTGIGSETFSRWGDNLESGMTDAMYGTLEKPMDFRTERTVLNMSTANTRLAGLDATELKVRGHTTTEESMADAIRERNRNAPTSFWGVLTGARHEYSGVNRESNRLINGAIGLINTQSEAGDLNAIAVTKATEALSRAKTPEEKRVAEAAHKEAVDRWTNSAKKAGKLTGGMEIFTETAHLSELVNAIATGGTSKKIENKDDLKNISDTLKEAGLKTDLNEGLKQSQATYNAFTKVAGYDYTAKDKAAWMESQGHAGEYITDKEFESAVIKQYSSRTGQRLSELSGETAQKIRKEAEAAATGKDGKVDSTKFGEEFRKRAVEAGLHALSSVGSANEQELDDEDKTRVFLQRRALQVQSDKIHDLYKKGRIDFSTMNQMEGSMKMTASIKDFGEAVDKFDEAIGRMPGYKEAHVGTFGIENGYHRDKATGKVVKDGVNTPTKSN